MRVAAVLRTACCSLQSPFPAPADVLRPLTRLASLSLSNCALAELPSAITGLPRLQVCLGACLADRRLPASRKPVKQH